MNGVEEMDLGVCTSLLKNVAMIGLRKSDGWEEIETGRLRASSCFKSGEANVNQ